MNPEDSWAITAKKNFFKYKISLIKEFVISIILVITIILSFGESLTARL